jgi:hypothetical protein
MKRLYRVTAEFVDGGYGGQVRYLRTWHYQDKRAAEHRAQVCREGIPEVPGVGHNGDEGWRPATPAAEWVRVERSNPITWPEPATT